ncbi:MAG: L-threonylcarbamoyladenylate synthase [Candidatus Omnitrophica bacterium]|nr:L-threonylcarbamoyladenylate synthase [Candidatus Omnitrophota bacterium]
MIHTKIVKLDRRNPDENSLKEAAEIIKNGGLVIIPTETVYGIAANMLNTDAIERLFQIKSRPKHKPFTLHIYKKESVEEFAQDIPVSGYKLMDRFWPGPLTLIFKSKKGPANIGIRLPDDEIAFKVIARAQVPVVCPSANISGKPPPKNFSEAIADFNGLVDFAIDAGQTRLGKESTLVDLTKASVQILRESAIERKDIEEIVNKKILLFVCTGNSCRSVMAKALLEKKLKEKNRQDVEVLSAGIMMLAGLGATPETKGLLEREGLDVSSHFSQKVTAPMIGKSDIILVMEKFQEDRIVELMPQAKNRVFLLKEFAKIRDNNLDIPDPIGKPLAFYESVFTVIKEAIEKVAELI